MATATTIDRKDGTGIGLTLAGVAGTASVYAAKYQGDVSANVFSLVYSTTIDVTNQTVALPVGSHTVVVVDDGGPSPPVSIRVTDGSFGIHHRCLYAVTDHVKALNLVSFPTDPNRYVILKRPSDTFAELKEAVGDDIHGCFFWNIEETVPKIGTNSEKDLAYVVQLVLVRSNQMSNRVDADWTKDRETLLKSFGKCPLPEVGDGVYSVDLYPGTLYSREKTPGVDVQGYQFRCNSYRPFAFD